MRWNNGTSPCYCICEELYACVVLWITVCRSSIGTFAHILLNQGMYSVFYRKGGEDLVNGLNGPCRYQWTDFGLRLDYYQFVLMFCFMGNVISIGILFLLLTRLDRTSEIRYLGLLMYITKSGQFPALIWYCSLNVARYLQFAIVKIVFISNYFCSGLLVYREGKSP